MSATPRRYRALRAVCLGLGLIAAAGGVLTAQSVIAGEGALGEAEAAFDRGDLRESVRLARRAASFRVPGAAHVDGAYARLIVIAQGAEAQGRRELAEFAWESVRGAAIATDSPWLGARPELARANASLARLAVSRGTAGRAADEAAFLRDLTRPSGPSRALLGLLGLGFALASGGLSWAALRGFSPEGPAERRNLLLGLALAAIGVACWTIAVSRA